VRELKGGRGKTMRRVCIDDMADVLVVQSSWSGEQSLSLGRVRRVHGVGDVAIIEVAGNTARG
jgi:hypothetical protein